MNIVLKAVRRLASKDDGQDLVEYGFLAALIAIVAIAGVSSLGNKILDVFWREITNAV